MQGLYAIEGNLAFAPALGELTTIPRGYIIVEDGIVRDVCKRLPSGLSPEVISYGDAIITPSFCDLHLHAPQFPMLGTGMDLQLLEWLSTYTFPLEARFVDTAYAQRVYRKLARALVRRGTTRVCMFSSIHREATLVLMRELERAGITGYVGKVNMDRNGPKDVLESTEQSVEETRRFLDECGQYAHLKPLLTPRFVPSCTDALMQQLGDIAREYPDVRIQSHLSENMEEIAWVKELSPDCAQYWQVYEKFGLFKPHTLMAHCVYSDEAERAAMKRAGVWVVHCPDSNTNVASGIAPIRKMLQEGMQVAMGSDIAGGAKLSMTDVAAEAIRVSKLRWLFSDKKEDFLTVAEAFYLITTAGQAYFGAQPGFGEGEPLHAVVFDDSRFVHEPKKSLQERLERLIYLSNPSDIIAVYSEGKKAAL
ncbi:MAG: amidohydrolase family protein [Christensenellaceae bacterium]|jgi:guanine deaminase|nr:amidohydrolase family protein [Christensenellaceae bacterium]